MNMAAEQQYIDLFTQYEALICQQSADILNAPRAKAFADFERQGFPTRKQEKYKYTDVGKFFEPDYGLNLNRLEFPVNPYEVFKCDVPNMSTSLYFVVNDSFDKHVHPSAQLPEGVIVGSLKDMAEAHPELVKGYYGVRAAVQNVHHRNRQTSAGYAAQKTIQRNVQCSCCGSCCGNGNCQNRIGTQIGLVLGAVCGDHCLVYCVQIRCVHTSDSFVDNGIDVFYSLGHALAQIASLVAVTQFQCFEFAGGSTAGGSTSCNSTVNQCDFCFYSRIASGIQNLSADNFFDLQITHSRILLYVSRKHCTNPAFRLCTQALYRVSFSITHVHFEVSYL